MRTRWLLVLPLLLTACTADPEPSRAAPAPATAPAPASPTPTPAAVVSRPTALPEAGAPEVQPVRLVGDGVDTSEQVVVFGQAFEEVRPALVAVLGPPSKDTGVISSFSDYGTCPGSTLRVLEFGPALRVLFGDVDGPGLTMYQWALTGATGGGVVASALVGDVTTYEFGVGSTLAELRAGVQGGAEVEVRAGDEVFGPSFTLTDQSSGFYGLLTGTADTDSVTEVQAGEGCGE